MRIYKTLYGRPSAHIRKKMAGHTRHSGLFTRVLLFSHRWQVVVHHLIEWDEVLSNFLQTINPGLYQDIPFAVCSSLGKDTDSLMTKLALVSAAGKPMHIGPKPSLTHAARPRAFPVHPADHLSDVVVHCPTIPILASQGYIDSSPGAI